MKELSIEEKAKRYDEAIKRVEDIKTGKCQKTFVFTEGLFDYIFPELCESEDERIRKALIKYYSFDKDGGSHALDNITPKQIVAYLKKQGEQKPTFEMKTPEESLGIDSDTYNKIVDECIYGEQKPAWLKELKEKLDSMSKEELQQLWDKYKQPFEPTNEVLEKSAWSEEDDIMVNDIDYALRCQIIYPISKLQSMAIWINNLKNRIQPKQEWKQENTGDLTDFENVMMHIGSSFFGQHAGLNPNDTNAIKQQANILLELASKQEWNKEDETNRDLLYNALNQVYDMKHNKDLSNWINKRILLCSQQQWKPSDEQIGVIEAVINNRSFQRRHLDSLYEQLKKLREE